MGGLLININNDDSISTGDQSVEKDTVAKRVSTLKRNLNKMPLFPQGQIWTLMTSLNFFNSPCPATILCSMTEFTNKSMAV